ncbi:MAG: pilin [Candidatus Andersenbacteria bacterium]
MEPPPGRHRQGGCNIIVYALGIAGGLAVLFIIVGGIYYITAQGDHERLEKAKKTIKNAIIGAVFILLALVIVTTVQSALKP